MKKVLVGISGGVDSAVTAAILKKQGFDVVGITFVFTEDFDTLDAKLVCDKLNIKHLVVDYKKEFKEKVITKFIEDYKSGITPNPCILCNRYVKFQFLYEEMVKNNCDYIATGHYAKVIDGSLYKGNDLNKDQSYFLCELTKEQLKHVIFPLEKITKEETRLIAKEFNLDNADKKDSYDVCFINNSFKEFISEYSNNEEGNIINVLDNKIIGKHNGLSKYTIGQRKGLNIGGFENRMYVVGKDINKNILYIATGDDNNYLISTSCVLDEVNILEPLEDKIYTAKFRYRQEVNEVHLMYDNDKLIVEYNQGIKAVTPGQICAIYDGDKCIAGGIIKEVRKNNEKLWYL